MLSDYVACACDQSDTLEAQIVDLCERKLPSTALLDELKEAKMYLLACKAKLMGVGLVVANCELAEEESKKQK